MARNAAARATSPRKLGPLREGFLYASDSVLGDDKEVTGNL